MIKELHLQKFKRFKDQTFSFRPSGVTLLAGGNNSGKSTILQALAVWEFCRTVIETKKGRSALEGTFRGDGIGISAEDFSPIALPSFDHLWTNLTPKEDYQRGQPNAAYTMRISCKWDDDSQGGTLREQQLEFGITLAHDRAYVKPLHSTVIAGATIPRFAYLPPFAGITAREERLSPAAQKRLIGRGLAGAALRNILFDLSQRSSESFRRVLAGRSRLYGRERRDFYISDPWSQLLDVLQRIFACGILIEPFDELLHTTVGVELFKGSFQNGRFTKFRGYKPRDIMVEGSGFLQWLSVYALSVNPEIHALLLDEPDAHLHPSLQSHLLDRLRSVARENKKQVLLATHSTEILRQVEPQEIFALLTNRHGYLSEDHQRIGLFQGLGSEYSPKLDQARRHKRILFVEGSFDENILSILAKTLTLPLPQNLVFWQCTADHSQRRVFFEQLRREIGELKAISILDRDSLELGNVGPDLTEHDYPDRNGNGLFCRTWRRRHLDNYLLVPTGIARASGRTETEVAQFLADNWGLCVGADYISSNCAPGLRDARGKEILYEGLPARGGEAAKLSVEAKFGCNRYDIARNLNLGEISEDIKLLVQLIRSIC